MTIFLHIYSPLQSFFPLTRARVFVYACGCASACDVSVVPPRGIWRVRLRRTIYASRGFLASQTRRSGNYNASVGSGTNAVSMHVYLACVRWRMSRCIPRVLPIFVSSSDREAGLRVWRKLNDGKSKMVTLIRLDLTYWIFLEVSNCNCSLFKIKSPVCFFFFYNLSSSKFPIIMMYINHRMFVCTYLVHGRTLR